MTVAGNELSGSPQHARTPSVIVLGTDALLAALPATPVQLAHACLQAGYQQVVPASWGDELVAQVVLRRLGEPRQPAAIQCSCPLVSQRLLASGGDLSPFLVSVVAPPVALARYLRSAYVGSGVHITYVGRCPGAAHDDIDGRLTPQELLAQFAEKGIDVAGQPRVFDSVVPPDRRRFYSQPGGLPSPEQLWSAGGQRTLAEIGAGDVASELVEVLLSGRDVLVDTAPRMGCFCSGASEGANAAEARSRIVALEPPRAASPVVRPSHGLALDVPIVDPVAPTEREHVEQPSRELADGAPQVQSSAPRRRSPSHGISRPVLGASPVGRDQDGRQLPRTYVARRRSTPRPFRVQIDVTGDSVTISEASAVVAPTGVGVATSQDEEELVHEREVRLLVTPVDSNGDAIAADRAAELAEPSPAAVHRASAAVSDEPIATPDAAGIEAPTVRATSSPAVEVIDPAPSARWENPPPRAPHKRPDQETPRRVRHDRAPHGPQVRKPVTERVVFPADRRSTSGSFRPSLRQVVLGLLVVTVVIAGAVALGFFLGRWATQPPAAAAGSATPRTTPPNGQSPNRPARSADSSLIDAL